MNLPAFVSRLSLRLAHNGPVGARFSRFQAAVLLLLLGASALVYAQDAGPSAIAITPKLVTHVMSRSSLPYPSALRGHFNPQAPPQFSRPWVNTGPGIVYTCDPSIDTPTCNYLNTTVAGYYNSTFTNANANIYITYGATGLGQSQGFYNLVTYDQYLTALNNISNKSPILTSALSALNTYAAAPYGSDNVEITVALGTALGFTGLTGTTPTLGACTPGDAGCYNEIITVINDPQDYGFSLYYDNLGGTEPANAYDFYAVVEHETDEVLGTSSCISTDGSLSDGCDYAGGNGYPSAVDLDRYSSAGNLVLDSSLSTTAGAYFSYDGGNTNGANGRGGTPKVYNTLANDNDYADYLSSPDCGTDEAIQDAQGCPGEDHGLTILNDGGSEVNILTAEGFQVPSAKTPAVLASPSNNSVLAGSNVKFSWTAATGSNFTGYNFRLGTTPGASNVFSSGFVTVTSITISGLPTNGEKIYASLASDYGSSQSWTYDVFTATHPAALTSPTAMVLAGPAVTFNWTTSAGATAYSFRLGTTQGANNLYASGIITATSASPVGLPTNGETVYARLYTYYSTTQVYTDYTFTAANKAVLTSPTAMVLSGSSVTFQWTAATGANRTGYNLRVGTSQGANNVFSSGFTTATSVATTMPTNSEKLYVSLATDYGSNQIWTYYVYTAAP